MTDPSEPPILDKIRNMWEFAAITQFFYLFFDMFGLDDFDVDVFEDELIGIKEPNLISQARLRLLQGLSSNRAITLENLDEFTRKQYIKKKPNANPFGDEENPTSWNELDVFAHIRVLRQLCTWQLINPERFRDRANVKDSEQLEWRVNPVGFDAEGNTYYLFDDNRLYYRDAPVIPEDKPSRKRFRGKKRKRGARRIVESEEPESPPPTNGVDETDEDATWHVQCISVDDYTPFLARLKRSRDPDEKAMYHHLHDNVLPAVIAEEEERERKRQLKEQEYLREQAYAARKRSNRLVQKEEDRKVMQERETEQAKLQAEEEERKRDEQRLKKLEQDREARLLLREQRQRERELRIQQREEERKRAQEEAEQVGQPIKISIKMSESPAPAKKTSRQQALESQHGTVEPQSQPLPVESWFFDCICGKHGVNYDDGGYTVACEKCEIWQHVDCLPNPQDREELNKRKDFAEGTYPDYEFVCTRCRKKAKEAAKLEGVKTKDQLRKEREREVNRAKYLRRKIREKAKKEEERRKREEEQRLGIQSSAGGQPMSSLSGEIRVLGISSSPVPASSSPERAPITTGQIYTLPEYPNINPNPSHVAEPSNQNVTRSPPTQFPQYPNLSQPQNFPQPHYQQPQQPAQRPQYSSQPQPLRQPPYLPPSQDQPPRQTQQYQPLRPSAAVPAYWSPYTTSPTLPNGQSFPSSRPYSAPYSNGVNIQPRSVAIKPSPTQGYRPPQHDGYPMPTSQQQERRPSSQSPAIQPRPSKTPEIQRPPSQAPVQNSPNLSREREFATKTDLPLQDSGWGVHSIQNPNERSVSLQNHPSQTAKENNSQLQYRENNNSWKSPPSQRNSLSPLLSQLSPHKPPSAQQGYQHSNPQPTQQIFKNENGSALSPVNRLAPASANVPDNTNQTDDKTAPKEHTPIVNGVVGDKGQGNTETANENERTKMAFLLN